ncbi:ABC transporter ATP-binding protein [Amycolatopsis benzoatilytica]|uniref:ABC transporter ATP-binding protein n=1 Tax=Amycolatopsis benzoatilytica TaxID=346045 RepID=UPI000380003F|nr:ABC transporter ATP-binding protein [Amycolatopsis benzoatilytica]
MIEFSHVSVTYDGADHPVLRDVSFVIEEGELCLVAGRTGVGKSTLLGAMNGLVPHFTGGVLSGRVEVDGRDTATHPPRELASVVGMVGQDPLAGFVTDTVEEELAYAMEQLAIAPDVMRKRVEETLDLLGIAELRNRPLRTLSGGQQQRVAIGAVLTAHPSVLVLDEPTSALDPTAAEEVLAAITRLVHDLGTTVVVAEHRMERVAQYADRLLYLPGDGTVVSGPPAEVFAETDVAPPIVELGRLAGWSPLPLSVRDARRLAGPLRDRLSKHPNATLGASDAPNATLGAPHAPNATLGRAGEVVLKANGVWVRYRGVHAVRGVDLQLNRGEVVALMGRNGSGKSSLLWALQGSGPRSAGVVDVLGVDPKTLRTRAARTRVGLVPQTPADLLYLDSVAAECRQADAESGVESGTARALLDRLVPGVADETNPRDLSEGQRLALVLAVQLAAAPPVVLLDEPTRGLDYPAKRHFAAILAGLAAGGHAVLLATHDVEFVASAAHRVVVLAEGEVVADGPTADVVVASPAFAPQVAKILAPEPWLTVEAVARALA